MHSAMPSSVARRLCPTAVFVDGRFHRYVEESGKLHAILQSVTPLVEGISLDEAFLDVTGSRTAARRRPDHRRRHPADGWPTSSAWTCSVGVGRSKLMAKLASKAAKPSASPVRHRHRAPGWWWCRPSGSWRSCIRCRSGPCGGWVR